MSPVGEIMHYLFWIVIVLSLAMCNPNFAKNLNDLRECNDKYHS